MMLAQKYQISFCFRGLKPQPKLTRHLKLLELGVGEGPQEPKVLRENRDVRGPPARLPLPKRDHTNILIEWILSSCAQVY